MNYLRFHNRRPMIVLEIRDALSDFAHRDDRVEFSCRVFQRYRWAGLPHVNTHLWKEYFLHVFVRDNNIDQALRALKKKMQREGIFRELKRRRAYEKPSEKRVREQSEAVRRRKKLERKKAQREGLLPRTGRGRPR